MSEFGMPWGSNFHFGGLPKLENAFNRQGTTHTFSESKVKTLDLGFPKVRDTLCGVPKTRITKFWGYLNFGKPLFALQAMIGLPPLSLVPSTGRARGSLRMT